MRMMSQLTEWEIRNKQLCNEIDEFIDSFICPICSERSIEELKKRGYNVYEDGTFDCPHQLNALEQHFGNRVNNQMAFLWREYKKEHLHSISVPQPKDL